MVGMPRISCLFRGAEPCIIMLMMLTILMIMISLLMIVLIKNNVFNNPMYLIIQCIKKNPLYKGKDSEAMGDSLVEAGFNM